MITAKHFVNFKKNWKFNSFLKIKKTHKFAHISATISDETDEIWWSHIVSVHSKAFFNISKNYKISKILNLKKLISYLNNSEIGLILEKVRDRAKWTKFQDHNHVLPRFTVKHFSTFQKI